MPTPCQYATPAARQAAYLARCRHAATATGFTVPGMPRLPAVGQTAGASSELSWKRSKTKWPPIGRERSEAWQESERGELFREQEEAGRGLSVPSWMTSRCRNAERRADPPEASRDASGGHRREP